MTNLALTVAGEDEGKGMRELARMKVARPKSGVSMVALAGEDHRWEFRPFACFVNDDVRSEKLHYCCTVISVPACVVKPLYITIVG
jgi:hypothetical protein